MSSLRHGAILASLLGLFTVGCQNQLHDDNLALHDQNNKLQAELTDARSKLSDAEGRLQHAPDPAQVAQMQARISELEEQLKQTQPQPAAGAIASGKADPSIPGIEATYDKARGTLTVNLPGEILFESGKAVLKGSAHATLDKIASAIRKDYAGKKVFIDGHTDNDPIAKTKDQWSDNWDLAATRANAVRKYLTSKGVDTHQVDLRAFGPTKPKSNKQASRRVEIVVQVD